MDIALVSLIMLQEIKDGGGTWQAFVIANLTLLVGLAFWAGVQSNRISNMGTRLKEHIEWSAQQIKDLQATSQAVTIGKLEEKMDHIGDRIDILQKDFDEFRGSIFIEAIRMSHGTGKERKPNDAKS